MDIGTRRMGLDLLFKRLADATVPVDNFEGDVPEITLVYAEQATQAERDRGAAILSAFDWTLTAEKAAAESATTNERTIEGQIDGALAANAKIISDGNTWLAGVGAGTANLTAAQLSSAVRMIVRAQVDAARQRNGLARLSRRRFDATD